MALFQINDPRQGLRLKSTLLGGAFYALCAAVIWLAMLQGLFPPFPLAVYVTAAVVVSVVFIVAIRFGWNLRFADPSMTQLQIACSSLLCSYVLIYAGPMRGLFMFGYVTGILFGGIKLTTRQLTRIACLPVVLFPVAVMIAAHQAPASVDMRVEFVNALALCGIMGFSVVLVGNMISLHVRLKASKADLQSALAKLTDLAVRDELTGLHNRRYVYDMLQRAKSVGDRYSGSEFCVCVLDIDHFKRINDTYGHGDGDTVLRTFAKTAEQCIRSTDLLARWGGEEFLLLLPQTPLDGAEPCIERIRARLAQTAFEGMPPELRVTMSAGAAQYREGEEIKDLIERADQALYAAKKAGRNRMVKAEA